MLPRWQTLVALVPLFGLTELGLHQWFSSRAPAFEDYAALAPQLLALKKPGEPVVVAPGWAEPLVRQAAGTAFPLHELARADDTGFRRFLEVSLLGAEAEALAEFKLLERRRVGPFELRVRENPRHEPIEFDFVAAAERGDMQVFNEQGNARSSCPWVEHARASTGGLHGHVTYPRRRFECDGGRFVGVTLIEDQGYRPRRCVLAQPPAVGSLVIRFAAAPASQRLVGWAGFSYFLGRDGDGGPITLSAKAETRELGRHVHRPEHGWERFAFDRAGEAGPVELTVHSDTRELRDFCFALEAR